MTSSINHLTTLILFISTTHSLPSLPTSTITTTKPHPPPSKPTNRSVIIIWLIFGPIILVIGLLGNSFVLLIMNKKIMGGSSTCVHLSALAGADLVVMVIGLIPEWFENCFDLVFKDIHPGTCKLEKFLFYSSADVSVWILVVFSLDRYVAIRHPLKRKAICTKKRARMFSVGVLVIALFKNLHVFWTRGIQYKWSDKVGGFVINKKCGTSHPAYLTFEEAIRPWMVFLFVNCLPAIVIIVCNIFIVKAMFKIKNSTLPPQSFIAKRTSSPVTPLVQPSRSTPSFSTRRYSTDLAPMTPKHSAKSAMLGRKSLQCSASSIVTRDTSSTAQSINNRSFLQMAAMCFSVSLCFLVCNTPSIVLYVGRRHWKHYPSYKASKPIYNFFVYVNHAINFLLYCIAGQRFRRLFGDVLCCRTTNHPREVFKRRYSDWSEQGVLTPARLRRLEELSPVLVERKRRINSPRKDALPSIDESF